MAKPKLFMKQKVMLRMVYALIPILISAIYFFGWRVLAVLIVTWAAGLATEFITARRRGAAISTANFVTCWLLALALPPTIPFWVAAVSAVVAILFGKEVFGGFGRNFANPAIVGRTFAYICFPTVMTARFVPAFRKFPSGFARWSFETLKELPDYLVNSGKQITDAVSQASPMWVNKNVPPEIAEKAISLWDMFVGSIGGFFQVEGETRILSAGSIGEGCAPLVILCGIYLLITKTANWRLMVSPLIGMALATGLFRNFLGFDGFDGVPPLHFTLVAGTTLYVVVFMITEPVSAPNRKAAIYVYGALIGFLMVVLRWKGVFVAAASFSILLGNLCAPLLDLAAESWNKRRIRSGAHDRSTDPTDKEGPDA